MKGRLLVPPSFNPSIPVSFLAPLLSAQLIVPIHSFPHILNFFLSNSLQPQLLPVPNPSCPTSFSLNSLQPPHPSCPNSFLSQLLPVPTPFFHNSFLSPFSSCLNSFMSQLLTVPTHSYPNTSTPSTLNSLQPTQHPSCTNSFLSQLIPVSIFFLSLQQIYSILPFTSPSPFAPFRSCIRSCDVYIQQIVIYYVGRSRYQGGSHLYIRILKRNSYVRILINCERVLVYIRTANKTDW